MKRSLLLFLLVVFVPFLHAEEKQGWPLPSAESFLAIIPAPPAEGSPADVADLNSVVAVQSNVSKEALAHAEKIVKFTVFTFSEVRGSGFTAEAFPKTAVFFKKLHATVNPPKNWLKDDFHRERPYKAHPEQAKLLVTPEGGFSYPSGHQLRAWVDALVLGELDPTHRVEYLNCAWQVGIDRMIGGMHYPSDTAASRALAQAMFADLMADPSFKAELEDLKKAEYQQKQ